jgi:hypothetical protein
VHNTSMPLTDHQTYSSNVLQVIDPIARQLLGASAPRLDADQRRRDSTRVVVIRRMRGVNLIAALVIAALAVTFPGFTDLIARTVQRATALVASFVGGLGAGGGASGSAAEPGHDDPGSSFLASGGSLTVVGMIVTAVVLAALLIWVNSVFSAWAERNVVWEWDHPLSPGAWAFLVSLVAFVYIAGSAALAALATDWAALALVGGVVLVSVYTLAVVALMLRPWRARYPRTVAQLRPLPVVGRHSA